MGTVADAFANIYRDWATDGLPASGANEPEKAEIRALGELIESMFGVSLGTVSTTKSTKALLDADLTWAANSTALVYADATEENNDLYVKSGGSGSGSWSNTGRIHAAIEAAAQGVLTEAAGYAATAEGAATALTGSRQNMIDAGIALGQNEGDNEATGFLMTSITSPATRRTITRGGDDITVATTTGLCIGFIFEEADQAGGRIYSADFHFTAGASTRDVGLGCTATARADTARADATETTPLDVEAAATNDTRMIGLRASGTVQCNLQELANATTTANSQIASNSFSTTAAPYTNSEVIRCTAYIPDDDTTERRLDWYIQTAGAGPFEWVGYATVDPEFWPQGAEVWAGANSTGTFTVEMTNRSVRAAGTEALPVRYMDGAAALIGLGTRDEPVSSLQQLVTSVDEETDTLTAYISANSGDPYRIVSSAGLTMPWTRFREIRLIAEAGDGRPQIRGSMPPPNPWTNVSGDVWKTENYYNNQPVTSNGGVVCYDCSEISGFATPGANIRWLYSAGHNVSTPTLQALAVPAYSTNGDGFMYIVLPNGEDPNDLDLELAQCGIVMTFAGPASALSLYRPKLIMQGLDWGGATLAALKAQLWDVDFEQCRFFGTGVEPLLLEECGGRTAACRILGSGGDGFKSNPYTGAGGSSFYSDTTRPETTHWDMEAHAAGHTGLSSSDNVSSHPMGGFQRFHGGRFWDATKHNMSMTEAFDAFEVDCRRGAQGGIVAAFDAARDGHFLIAESYIEDAGIAAIDVVRLAGVGITTGSIRATRIARPNVATPIGIKVSNSGTVDQVVLDDIDNRIDSTVGSPITTPRSGYSGGTVTQRTYA